MQYKASNFKQFPLKTITQTYLLICIWLGCTHNSCTRISNRTVTRYIQTSPWQLESQSDYTHFVNKQTTNRRVHSNRMQDSKTGTINYGQTNKCIGWTREQRTTRVSPSCSYQTLLHKHHPEFHQKLNPKETSIAHNALIPPHNSKPMRPVASLNFLPQLRQLHQTQLQLVIQQETNAKTLHYSSPYPQDELMTKPSRLRRRHNVRIPRRKVQRKHRQEQRCWKNTNHARCIHRTRWWWNPHATAGTWIPRSKRENTLKPR